MKINSKILSILLVLLAVGMIISAVSAVDLADEFKNDDFGIKAPSGNNFNETVNIATNGMGFEIFENSGNDASDVNSIIYFKDSSADNKEISSFIKDLENSGNKVEETGKYVVLENDNNYNLDIGNDLSGIFDFVGNIFSSEGLNVSAGGDSISLSDKGLEISDASGENVYITTEGISISGNASSDNVTVDVSSDVDSNIKNSHYSLYLKNKNNDKVIVISGNNLELLKAMAETVTFNEN